MALKAGYIGIKKSMLGLINSLASAKLIKTIGDGLKLTKAGTISVNIDSNTMEFVGGKLASKAQGFTKSELAAVTERTVNMPLSDPVDDFDYIEIIIKNAAAADPYYAPVILFPVSELANIEYVSDSNGNPHILAETWANTGFSIGYDSTNNAIRTWGYNGTIYIAAVNGIKY